MLIYLVIPDWKAEVSLHRTAWKPERNFVVSLKTAAGVVKIYFAGVNPLVVLSL
jgi:hypothetical protein